MKGGETSNMKKKGFTLIELLVVIAIIGLLSTLAVIALNNARQKSRDAKRVADVKQLQTALEMYYNQYNSYPPCGTYGTENDGAVVAVYEMNDTDYAECAKNLKAEFFGGIESLHDPKDNTDDPCNGAEHGDGTDFCNYSYQGYSNGYAIYFVLEDTTGSELLGGLRTASESGIQ